MSVKHVYIYVYKVDELNCKWTDRQNPSAPPKAAPPESDSPISWVELWSHGLLEAEKIRGSGWLKH